MNKRKQKKQKRQPKRDQSAIITVDGINYKIPAMLRGCTDEELTRIIRGWKR